MLTCISYFGKLVLREEELIWDKRVPDHITFETVHQSLGESGDLVNVISLLNLLKKKKKNVGVVEHILKNLRGHPGTSSWRIAYDSGINQSTMWRTVHKSDIPLKLKNSTTRLCDTTRVLWVVRDEKLWNCSFF